jgi:4-oxalocrotonate tautomerase
VAQLPKEAVWVVFEDVAAEEWYVGSRSVAEIRKGAASS